MSASLHMMPIWKKDSTPAEWLAEVGAIALEHPEYFGRIVVVYESVAAPGEDNHVREQSYKCGTNTDIMGLLATGQLELREHMKGRR